jgi:TonB family protein
MAPVKNRAVFTEALLPEGERRWRSFSAGIGLECVALLALILIPLFMPQKFQAVAHDFVMPIEAPIIQAWKPQPQPKPVIKREIVKEIPKPPVPVVVPKPQIFNPVITAPVVKRVTARKTVAPEEVAKVFPDPKPPLSMGSSAIPTLKRPREAVQTGGFGDPNGVPTNKNTDRNVNVAKLGSFDMPAGPGEGNGTGGAKGAKGVVSSAGFGNGVAVGGSGGGNHGSVHQGLFADEQAAPESKVKRTAAVSNTKPVEILSVPKPVYTKEGIAKRIEGDVRLEVVFTASGEVRVLRVIQGLGSGLDEAAEAAAREIRFHPALQDGQPVDSEVAIRITFELAY